jgi:hypothetical protein
MWMSIASGSIGGMGASTFSSGFSSVLASKPANGGQRKTGQRMPGT